MPGRSGDAATEVKKEKEARGIKKSDRMKDKKAMATLRLTATSPFCCTEQNQLRLPYLTGPFFRPPSP